MSKFDNTARGGVTNEVYTQLQAIYNKVDQLINLIGLEYDFDSSEFYCTNQAEVDEDWCDEDLLRDLDYLHTDLGYFLDK